MWQAVLGCRGRSPSRFDQLLAAEVSHLDASERTPTIAGWEPLLLATAPQFGLEPPIWPEPAEFWPFHLHQAGGPGGGPGGGAH